MNNNQEALIYKAGVDFGDAIKDIEQLQELGVWGVVFGKAFYEGMLTLKDLEQFIVKA